MKKKWTAKEMFTKSMGDRYKEMSKSEKIGYWICIAFTLLMIVILPYLVPYLNIRPK